MRFTRLELRSYGHFEGWSADVPDVPLVVLLGPNEAGKSTLHEGLLDLLFGVPHKSARTFAFDGGALRLSADLALRNGTATVERRKGRKDTLEGALLREGETIPLDETGLARLLELDRGGYEGLFGFGLQHLERGADLLTRADVATVLAGGSLGGGADGVLGLRSRLESAHQSLFKERATTRPINDTLRQLQAARKATRKASLSRRGFAEAVKERDAARAEADARQEEVRAHEVAHRRLRAQQAARGELQELAALPDPDAAGLEQAAAIDRLVKRHGPAETHRATLAEDKAALDQERDSLTARLTGVWPGAGLDQLRAWSGDLRLADRLDAAVRTASTRSVQRLAQERRASEARKQVDAITSQQVEDRGPDDDALAALAQELEQGIERRRVSRRAEDDHKGSEAALRAERERLHPPLPPGFEDLKLPARDAVAAHAQAAARRRDDLRDARRQLAEAEGTATSLSAEVESRREAAGLPSEHELIAARERRDGLLDAAIADGARAPYDAAVAEADALADRLWRGASTAAFLQGRRADLAAAQARVASAEAELKAITADAADEADAWAALWAPSGIAPTEPPAMVAWLRTAEELRGRSDRLLEARREDRARTNAQEAFLARIRALLPDAEDPIAALQAAVVDADRRRRAAAERAQDLGTAAGHLEAAERAIADLDAEAEAAARLHVEQLQDLGFDAGLSPEAFARRAGALTSLREALVGLDSRASQYRSRRAAVDAFDADLDALRATLSRPGATLDAIAADLTSARRRRALLEQLGRHLGGSEALEAARDALAQGRLDDLDARVAASEQALEDLKRRASEAATHLGEATERFRQLGGSDAAEAEAEHQELRARLEQQAEDWAANRLALAVLDRAIERFTRDHQPELLARTSALLATLTGGRWATVERPLVGQDKDTLRVVSADGSRRLVPSKLSRGTREQLFLAIRLAWVAEHCAVHEPLPVLADDVLVNFDPDRSRRALEAFAGIGTASQTLYLTCQPHLAELARGVGGAVIELPDPPGLS